MPSHTTSDWYREYFPFSYVCAEFYQIIGNFTLTFPFTIETTEPLIITVIYNITEKPIAFV